MVAFPVVCQNAVHNKDAIINPQSEYKSRDDDVKNIYLYFKDGMIVGMITLLIEQKLIHNGACVAHIEDLVIDKHYQKQGIASELIQYCLKQISSDKCYKIILNCKKDLIPFYIKKGFKETNVQMSKYF